MYALSVVFAIFSILGALDYITGNHFGLGKEFDKAVSMLSLMFISMVGMILFAPVIAQLLTPFTEFIIKHTPFDPSILSGMILASDMGGAPLAQEIADDYMLGQYNGLIVGSTLGATISYTIPFALSVIDKKYHVDVLMGILCGIVTIPIGCIISGLMLKIPLTLLLINSIPLIIFSGLVVLGLLKAPSFSVKVFSILGKAIMTVIVIGLALGIFEFLTGIKIIGSLAPLREGTDVIINTTCVMTGSFPLIFLLSKILNRPLSAIGSKTGLGSKSVLGFLASAASFATCIPLIPEMDKKGRIANLAFAVSGAFTLAGHLAFTLSFNPDFVLASVVGKLASGFTAIIVAVLFYKKLFV